MRTIMYYYVFCMNKFNFLYCPKLEAEGMEYNYVQYTLLIKSVEKLRIKKELISMEILDCFDFPIH